MIYPAHPLHLSPDLKICELMYSSTCLLSCVLLRKFEVDYWVVQAVAAISQELLGQKVSSLIHSWSSWMLKQQVIPEWPNSLNPDGLPMSYLSLQYTVSLIFILFSCIKHKYEVVAQKQQSSTVVLGHLSLGLHVLSFLSLSLWNLSSTTSGSLQLLLRFSQFLELKGKKGKKLQHQNFSPYFQSFIQSIIQYCVDKIHICHCT